METNKSNFFENNSINEEERRSLALQVLSTLREAINIARKDNYDITYEKTLDLVSDIDPTLYESFTKLLVTKNESDTVKLYKELAEAKSTDTENISPIDLIDEELEKMEKAIQNNNDKKFIKRKIVDLKGAKEYFQPRKISEHKALAHDYFLANRGDYFSQKVYQDDFYTDYKLNKDRVLRLRLLHPDREEAILGTDLIYEQFDLHNNKVRFVHLQYKMWDDGKLYLNDTRMQDQIKKMEASLCQSKYCEGNTDSKNFYRFPHCSGFLRPTSKLKNAESKLATTGIHVPICYISKLAQTENKLTKQNCANNYISNKFFENLFHSNMLGSRWIPIEELESFYEKKQIHSFSNTIRIHAQEAITISDEEKYSKKK